MFSTPQKSRNSILVVESYNGWLYFHQNTKPKKITLECSIFQVIIKGGIRCSFYTSWKDSLKVLMKLTLVKLLNYSVNNPPIPWSSLKLDHKWMVAILRWQSQRITHSALSRASSFCWLLSVLVTWWSIWSWDCAKPSWACLIVNNFHCLPLQPQCKIISVKCVQTKLKYLYI